MKYWVWVLFAASLPAQIYTPPAPTQLYTTSPLLRAVGINQKMGAQIPLDLPFVDESGRDVTLRQYFGKPVILALVYYQCPSLCNMVLNGIVHVAKDLPWSTGKEFDVIAVSFDPRETPEMARAKKQSYMKDYDRAGSEQGWHFLTGSEKSSVELANAVGFHFAYDAMTNQYAHPSAILILTPEGQVARYFYGINYPPRDVRLGLVEASQSHIASPVDQVLLYCYHYDPSSGKYGMVVMNVIRLGALLTLGTLVTFMLIMFRRDFGAMAHKQVQ
ncbi:MAG: SCO family protein [Bryobacteraceae bacterium]|jgi:protein SCO1/2